MKNHTIVSVPLLSTRARMTPGRAGPVSPNINVPTTARPEDDLTKLAERSERPSLESALLASIVECSDDAIITKDLNGIVTSWNPAAERIFGYTAEEIIGRPIVTLIPPDRPNEEPAILERIRGGERVDHYETVRRRKDGARLDISVT